MGVGEIDAVSLATGLLLNARLTVGLLSPLTS